MRRLVNSSALQSWMWQLIGMSYWYRGAVCSKYFQDLVEPSFLLLKYTVQYLIEYSNTRQGK